MDKLQDRIDEYKKIGKELRRRIALVDEGKRILKEGVAK